MQTRAAARLSQRAAAKAWRRMRDRIQARIEQLEQERLQNRAALEMRECEINGSIQALRDVLSAMEKAEQEGKAA